MIRVLLIPITLVWALTLTGCATTTPAISNLKSSISISAEELDENTGIIVGTYTKNVGEKEYDQRRLFFTDTQDFQPRYAIDRRLQGSIVGQVISGDYKVKDNDKEGDVFAFVVPAGEYMFYNFFLESGYSIAEQWSSVNNFSIPFVVHPNKVNYIGEINFTALSRDRKATTIFSKKQDKRGGYWTISDQLVRDKTHIAEKFKNLPLNDIQNIIPQSKKAPVPFIVLPNEIEEFEASLVEAQKNVEDDDSFGDPINTLWMTCKKPYVLKQDCSMWSGAKKKIHVGGRKLYVASSNDGKVILVMRKGATKGGNYDLKDLATRDRLIDSSYYTVKKLLNDNGINVDKTRILKEVVGISGYVLLLDQDGYSLFDNFIEKKE